MEGLFISSKPDLIHWARSRVEGLAPDYRARGWWGISPDDLVGQAAIRNPERTALVDPSSSITYAELDVAATAAAAELVARGVEPGTPVLIVMANDIASAVAFHGARRAGAIIVVLQTTSSAAEIADAVTRLGVRLAVAPEEQIEVLELAGATATSWIPAAQLQNRSSSRRDSSVPAARDPDDPVIVMFTSGTTARPKAVVHTTNTLLVAARNLAGAIQLNEEDGFFLVSPLSSITGVLQALCIAPMLGIRAVLERRFDDRASFDRLLTSGATFYGGPDVVLGRLLAEADRRGCRQIPITAALFGGTVLDERILDRAANDFGILIMRSYGSSEAPVTSATRRDEPAATRTADEGPPLEGVDVRIGSKSDSSECCVRGAHLFVGYVDDVDNEAAFEDGWFRTGDVATLDSGRLRITGRIKDIVIRNGLKISLARVEALASDLPGVEQCVAYGVPDDATGERLSLAVRREPGTEPSFELLTRALAENGLAKWMLPEEVVVWEGEFPTTATGKVKRAAVAEGGGRMRRLLAPRLRDMDSR